MFIDNCMELTQPLFNVDCKLNLCGINENTEAGIYDFFCMDAGGCLSDNVTVLAENKTDALLKFKATVTEPSNYVGIRFVPAPLRREQLRAKVFHVLKVSDENLVGARSKEVVAYNPADAIFKFYLTTYDPFIDEIIVRDFVTLSLPKSFEASKEQEFHFAKMKQERGIYAIYAMSLRTQSIIAKTVEFGENETDAVARASIAIPIGEERKHFCIVTDLFART